jgi:uncharacterized protein
MLIEFTVGNFRSFRTPQTLSMVAAPLKAKESSLDENVLIVSPNQPTLLSSTAVYGPNASGKSNLIQAFHFMRQFVLNSTQATQATGGINLEPFRLDPTTETQPSHFEIVFICDGLRYRYGFEATSERVQAEWLYFVPTSREARLFTRAADEVVLGNHFKEGRNLDSKTRPNALFLSVVAQFNGQIAQKLLAWFRRIGIISGVDDTGLMPYTLKQLQQGEHQPAIKALICRLDLGISDLQVAPTTPPTLPDGMPEKMQQALLSLLPDDAEYLTVHTSHTKYEGNTAVGQTQFDLDEHESAGTKKIVAFAGPLVDTLSHGKLLIVDELDARLHPLLTRELIRLFNDKTTNPHGAQLLFNTHDLHLLDNRLFRRDQIWFVEKDEQGATHLYALAEFAVRNDKDFARGYTQGLFGAVPYLAGLAESFAGA